MATCGDNGGRNAHGEPCKRPLQVGYTRCNLHGGATIAAKMKAEQALAQARLPACEALYTIIERWTSKTCPACGYPSGDNDEARTIIRAAQVILDRSGLGPHATLEVVPQADGDLRLELMLPEERTEFAHLVGAFKALKSRIKARMGLQPAPRLETTPQADPIDLVPMEEPVRVPIADPVVPEPEPVPDLEPEGPPVRTWVVPPRTTREAMEEFDRED